MRLFAFIIISTGTASAQNIKSFQIFCQLLELHKKLLIKVQLVVPKLMNYCQSRK